jgi:hypothetical protein
VPTGPTARHARSHGRRPGRPDRYAGPPRPAAGDARTAWDGHDGPVKLRIGMGLAFAVGYALGSRAGRERYLQVVRVAGQVGRSGPVSGTTSLIADKTRAAATLGMERLKDTIGVRLGWRDGDDAADAIVLDLAEDLANAISNRRLPPAGRSHHPMISANGSAQASSR